MGRNRKVDRYADMPYGSHSEYGGGEVPQRLPDGSSRDLVHGVVGSESERARLMRQAGMADYDPDALSDITVGEIAAMGVDVSKMSAAQRIAYENDMVLARERAVRRASLRERTNGYIDEPEQYVGEDVSTDPSSSAGLGSDLKRSIEGDFSA